MHAHPKFLATNPSAALLGLSWWGRDQCTLYTKHSTHCTSHTLYTTRCVPCTVHPALHCTNCTFHRHFRVRHHAHGRLHTAHLTNYAVRTVHIVHSTNCTACNRIGIKFGKHMFDPFQVSGPPLFKAFNAPLAPGNRVTRGHPSVKDW